VKDANQKLQDQDRQQPKNYDQLMESLQNDLIEEMRQRLLHANKQARKYAAGPQGKKIDLGLPASRQDAILLHEWYTTMNLKLKQHPLEPKISIHDQESASNTASASKSLPNSETLQLYELTLKVAIKELCRQVTVQCTERGALLHLLFE
jgi:hypothetical protein